MDATNGNTTPSLEQREIDTARRIAAPPRGLTPKFIDALQPAERTYSIADRRAPGLRLHVFPSGVRSFYWSCTSRKKCYTIGKWSLSEQPGFVTLAQARGWLERLKAAHANGTIEAVAAELRVHLRRRPRIVDPVPETPDRRTFGAVAEEFYEDDIFPNRKYPEDVRAILDNDVLPALGARRLDAITAVECRDAVRRVITGRGRTVGGAAPAHAGKVLATIKQIFTWAQANGITERNPAASLKAAKVGVDVRKRNRALSAEEISIFWRALDAEPDPHRVERRDTRTGKTQVFEQRPHAIAPATAAALKILILTGVRTGALLNARWENVDLEGATWTIPPANQKLTKKQEREAKPFVIPLTPTALALFNALQARAGSSPWVMASGASHDGKLNEKTLGHALKRLQRGERPTLVLLRGHIRPHDLRRTMRTHLGKLRVPPHVAERCLGHSLGRIVDTYDVGDYLDERREAMERWNAYVLRLVDPAATNVIPMVAGSTL